MSPKHRILIVGGGGAISKKRGQTNERIGNTSDAVFAELPYLSITGAEVDAHHLIDLDSADAGPEEWKKIADVVYDKYHEYDAFVIMFGMDTLTYLAAALSFALRNAKKPIVLTAAAEPISKIGSDARKNVEDSMLAAIKHAHEGVCICIDGCVIKGTRVHKLYNEQAANTSINMSKYISSNFPIIGVMHHGRFVRNAKYDTSCRSRPPVPLELKTDFSPQVGFIKMFPGRSGNIEDSISNSAKALVIEALGTGNIPLKNTNWIDQIKKISKKIPVFITTQDSVGTVDLTMYEGGKAAAKAGAISLHDMTTECAIVKLMWLLGNFNPSKTKLVELMHHNFVDEVIVPGQEAKAATDVQ